MNNPEASVRKNINIKFKSDAVELQHPAIDQHHQIQQPVPVAEAQPNSYHHRNEDDDYGSRHSSRSRSSRSRSRSSSRSRSRSYKDEEDDYSSSRYSESPQRSSFKRSSNSINNNQGGQFGEKIVDWNFQLNFVSERIQDPTIFICDICRLPVINYGRLLPCKHTFCYPCAVKMNGEDSKQCCTKCRNAITSVELCPPGQLFVCTFGGSKLHGGCRRAYRSSEDLQTHANQRHNGSYGTPQNSESPNMEAASTILASIQVHQPSIQPAPLHQLMNTAQLSQSIFQSRPPHQPAGAFPFANPMMAQALLFQQQQAAAAPFLFRSGPAGLFMAANMPPPIVFSTATATPQPANPNTSQQTPNPTAGQ